jgi:photosystem II stability/assembly factor-like uncharacterized protein
VPLPGVEVNAATSSFAFFSENVVYALLPAADGQTGNFYITRDGGATWEIRPAPFAGGKLYFVNEAAGFAYQIIPVDAASTQLVIYQTLDAGLSWNQVYGPSATETITPLPLEGLKNGLSFIDPSRGWIGETLPAGQSLAVHAAPDSGRNWQKQELSAPPELLPAYLTIQPPVFFPSSEQDGFLPVDFVSPEQNTSTRIFYSTHDGGTTWAAGAPIPDSAAYTFINPATGWAWSGHNLYFTSDSAATWTALPVAFARTERASCINFIDVDHGWLLTTDLKNHVHMYATNDGGNTWTVIIP